MMKNILLSGITIITHCFLGWSQSDTICNPSFEDSLASWVTISNGGATINAAISSDSLYSGDLGLILEADNVAPPSSTCALTSCLVNLQQGSYYKISFWAKSDTQASLLVVLQATSSPFINYAEATVVTSSTWTEYSVYTADSNAVEGVKLKVKPEASGIYYFDDFFMESITSLPTNTVVCNSDFEIGLSEWTQSPNGGEIEVLVEGSEVQSGASSVKVIASNTISGEPILSSCKSDIEENKKYEISFWMKSEMGGETIVATSSLSASPYTNYGQTSITLSDSWAEYSFISEADTTVYSNVRFAKFKFLNDGVFYVDNITISEVPPQPLFCDGDFETGITDWTQTVNNEAIASISVTPSQAQNGLQSAMVLLNTPGTTNGSVQFSSCPTDVVQDSVYTVSFWVKGSTANLNFNAITSFSSSPFTALASNSFQTNADWTEYCYTFSHDSTVIGGIRLLKLQFLDAGTYYIDNATVQDENYICSSAPPSNVLEHSFDELNLWPNPSFGVLHLKSSSSISNLFVKDLSGKIIFSSSPDSFTSIVNVSNLNVGTYFIVAELESEIRIQKRWIKL
jgi:hypothetical protein